MIQINYAMEKVGIIYDTKPFMYGYITETSCSHEILTINVQSAIETYDIKP
jgi:hypothetical protein